MGNAGSPTQNQSEFVTAQKYSREPSASGEWSDECPDHLPAKSSMYRSHADIIEAAASDREWDSFAELARSVDSVDQKHTPMKVLRSFWITRAMEISSSDHDLEEYREYDPCWSRVYNRSDYDPILQLTEDPQLGFDQDEEVTDILERYLEKSGLLAKQASVDVDNVQAILGLIAKEIDHQELD